MQGGQAITMRMGGLVLAVVVALFAISRVMGPGGTGTAPEHGAGKAVHPPAIGAVPQASSPTQAATAAKPAVAAPPGGTPAAAPAAPAAKGVQAPPASSVATATSNPQAAAPAAPAANGRRTALLEAAKTPAPERERVEADVSTRSVAVTSAFTGVEIVVFGSVINTKSESAESGLYDVVVVVEGAHVPLVARKKSNVAGLWINTSSVNLSNIPSYYAIASTRPLTEIAEGHILSQYRIGFEHMHMDRPEGADVSEKEFADFKQAVIRLKKKEGVYVARDYNVAFIGQALFRASIALPANVPVGPLSTRVHLFRDGEHLSSYTTKLKLEREGVERWLHSLAFDHGLLYGIMTVIIAVASGLLASMMFRKAGSH